ncbi:MAG: hypothetical protein RLO12_03555 [Fulvivirga sp.]
MSFSTSDLSHLDYISLANYSPTGTNDISSRSRKVCGAIKASKAASIDSIFKYLDHESFSNFLNQETVLVPVPSSSLRVPGGNWPSLSICQALVKHGFGSFTQELIKRTKAIPKSSSRSSSAERNSVQDHIDSLAVNPTTDNITNITLVDDVVTQGRTSMACAVVLNRHFSSLGKRVYIRLFTVFQTRSFDDAELNELVNVHQGKINYYASGKTFRE